MKYAIISDIHGNIHALNAVLDDVKVQGADMYLLLGDYTICYPWGNEVTDVIRGLTPAVVIGGNGENYFNEYIDNKIDFNNEQFKPAYWAYRSLTSKNLDYLMSLPKTAQIFDNGSKIYLSHFIDLFRRLSIKDYFHCPDFRKMMEKEPFTHSEYLERAQKATQSCPDVLSDIKALPKGIYLFGHNHLQFHMEYEGRLFINPGSCGQAMDCDTTAPYTLLTCEADRLTVTERRIEYDLDKVAKGLISSGFADYSPMWSKIATMELMSGKNYMTPFVMHLLETGRMLGQTEHPVSNEVWDEAIKTWDQNKI